MKDLSNLKILIIDDTEELLEFHETWMKKLNVNSLTSIFGKKGIEMFKNEKDIDLVILDMNLPDMTGEEVFVKLREIRNDVPIVISSGYGDEYQELKEDKMVEVLQKPFFLPAMVETIGGLTGR